MVFQVLTHPHMICSPKESEMPPPVFEHSTWKVLKMFLESHPLPWRCFCKISWCVSPPGRLRLQMVELVGFWEKKTTLTWLMVKSFDFPAKSISNQPSQPSNRKSRGSCPKRWDDTWYPHKLPARFWGPLPEVGVGASSDRWLKKWLGVVVAGLLILVWQYANGLYIYIYPRWFLGFLNHPQYPSLFGSHGKHVNLGSRELPQVSSIPNGWAHREDHAFAFANRTNRTTPSHRIQIWECITLWLCQNSYWKWP